MTEQEWLECTDPTPMLEFFRCEASERKLRLFACACCYRTLDNSPYEELASAVKVAEDLVDETADPIAIADANEAVIWGTSEMCESLNLRAEGVQFAFQSQPITATDTAHAVERVLLGWQMNVPDISMKLEKGTQSSLLRDIFHNPFRTVTIDPRWLTSSVVDLATAIYAARAFDRVPILADALTDAGCDNEEIINHFRSEGPHVLGCWAIDLLLGKK